MRNMEMVGLPVSAESRQKYGRGYARTAAEAEHVMQPADLAEDRNTLPITITIAVLFVMGVVIMIDFHFMLGLMALTILGIGGIIAAIAYLG